MRPPAPTKIECQHGRQLQSGVVWSEYLCLCCGNDHRSAGHLCLSCRPLKSLTVGKARSKGK